MYNNCSTLLYKYNPRHKKTHRIGGRSDNISILLNADSPSNTHNESITQYIKLHTIVNLISSNTILLLLRLYSEL